MGAGLDTSSAPLMLAEVLRGGKNAIGPIKIAIWNADKGALARLLPAVMCPTRGGRIRWLPTERLVAGQSPRRGTV